MPSAIDLSSDPKSQNISFPLAGAGVPLVPWPAVKRAEAVVGEKATHLHVEYSDQDEDGVADELLERFRDLRDDSNGTRTKRFLERFGALPLRHGLPCSEWDGQNEIPLDWYRWWAGFVDLGIQSVERARTATLLSTRRTREQIAADLCAHLAEKPFAAEPFTFSSVSLFHYLVVNPKLGRSPESDEQVLEVSGIPVNVLASSIANGLLRLVEARVQLHWPDGGDPRVAVTGGLWAAVAFGLFECWLGGTFAQVCDICGQPALKPRQRRRKTGQLAFCGRPECKAEQQRRRRARHRGAR